MNSESLLTRLKTNLLTNFVRIHAEMETSRVSVCRLTDGQTDTDTQLYRYTDTQTHSYTDTQTHRYTNRSQEQTSLVEVNSSSRCDIFNLEPNANTVA